MKFFILITISFLVYSNTLKNSFVWDDISIIVNNKWIRTPLNFFKFFYLKDTVSEDTRQKPKIYRPLTTFSYSIDYFLWKLSSFGYHLSNLIFHSLTVIVVYLLSEKFFEKKIISFISASIFALHPVHTEAVSWIKGRADVIACMFGLLAFLFYIVYLDKKKISFYVMSLISFTLSLFSKESTITIVVVLIIYDLIFKKRIFFKNYIFYILISIIYIFIRKLVLGSIAMCSWWGGSEYYTFLTMTKVFVEYFRLLIFPINLCADYVVELSFSLWEYKVLLSLFFVIFLIIIGIFLAKRYPVISFGVFFIFITLIPVSNIIPIEVLLAERFLYLPSFGICLILGEIFKKIYYLNKKVCYMAFILISLPYFLLTYQRNKDWKDEFTLWYKTVNQCPNNFRAHNNLGMEYEKKGDLDNALKHYKKALTLVPNLSWIYNDTKQMYARVHSNIGNVYLKKKNFNNAFYHYNKSINLDPFYSQAYFNLGILYRQIGDIDLAIKYYKKAIELNPYIAEYYNNLGVAYALKNNFDEAIVNYEKAINFSLDENFKNQVYRNIEIAKSFLNKNRK